MEEKITFVKSFKRALNFNFFFIFFILIFCYFFPRLRNLHFINPVNSFLFAIDD